MDKSHKRCPLHDAIIGSDGVYIYCKGGLIGEFLGEGISIQNSAFVAKMDFIGEWTWINRYGGLQRHWSPERSLALDGEENLILASGLWNYTHPSPTDTLIFMSDTCYCSALDLQFPLCTTTLKWDTDGNELAYHVLDAEIPSYTNDVGADFLGNYYISGRISFSWIPPLFSGVEVGSGEFVLKFGADNSENWLYNRSNQVESHNSGLMWFISANEQESYFEVHHNSYEVVTDDETFILNQPNDGPLVLLYKTIHVVDNQTGALDTVDFYGHISSWSHLKMLPNGQVFTVSDPLQDFEHSFPPYAYNPIATERLILSKEILGDFNEPVIFEDISVSFIDNFAHSKLYLYLRNTQDPVEFGLNGSTYSTLTENCIVILDKTSNIEEGLKKNNELTVFPNPLSNGPFSIRSGFPMVQIVIFDARGQLVCSQQLNEQRSAQIQHTLESGFYTVQVIGEDIKESRSLIVY